MIEEITYISEFNVNKNGTIAIRKTTDLIKDEVVIASTYWRCVLEVNDPMADEILGINTYYRNLAEYAWNTLTPVTIEK